MSGDDVRKKAVDIVNEARMDELIDEKNKLEGRFLNTGVTIPLRKMQLLLDKLSARHKCHVSVGRNSVVVNIVVDISFPAPELPKNVTRTMEYNMKLSKSIAEIEKEIEQMLDE